VATEALPVTVDRSHLIVIGEKLYARSLELVRELVNNAYDADATEVHVRVSPDAIEVDDDGSGMDRAGLLRYFQVGVPDKREHPISPRFGRDRIGQFGIGKFATLAACRRFEVLTRRGGFSARVVFDRVDWEEQHGSWHLPMEVDPPDGLRADGTSVRLTHLTKRFDAAQVREFLVETVPVRAERFAIYVNGLRLLPRSLAGRRIPFLEGTAYGVVHGEAVVLPASHASTDGLGLEVRVKGVTVRRELFGMQAWGKLVTRIRGEVNADFLPLTADRSSFVEDSPEYRAFVDVMTRVMDQVDGVLRQLALRKEHRVAGQAVTEALARVEVALRRHPELSPTGAIPIGEEAEGSGEPALVPSGDHGDAGGDDDRGDLGNAGAAIMPGPIDGMGGELGPPEREPLTPAPDAAPRVRRLTPNAVVRRVHMGQAGLTCCIDGFGPDEPESFTEGTIIYVNRDHPLYQHEAAKKDTLTRHVARLITQELALMKERDDPRRAFAQQSILLRESFADD
jgi:Histidine kinase-, DNA gyrase B-, and HSP90-like ATPase